MAMPLDSYVSFYSRSLPLQGESCEQPFDESHCAELQQYGIAIGATLPLRRWQALELVNHWNRNSGRLRYWITV